VVEEKLKHKSRLCGFSGAALLFAIVLTMAGFMAPTFADESVSISCYKDWKSSWSLGSVVILNEADAPQAYNSMYYDCGGRCIGCYQDSDYVDNVCIDMQGRTFLQ